MKATQYTTPRQFAVTDLPKPKSGPHQVVVRVKACGICKTNLTIRDGSFLAKFPLVNGHELAGMVDSTDSAVTEQKVGGRTIVDNAELCGYREPCRSDKPLYCENFNSHGYNMPDGFAEYVLINRDKVFTLNDKLFSEEATFTEPAACAIHGVDCITLRFDDSILMSGADPTGIILTQLLRRAGAGCMVIVDPHAGKLDILRKYGLTDLVVMGKTSPFKHTAEIKAIMSRGFDIVINTTGAASVSESCFHFARMGSKIVTYGVYATDARVSASPCDIFGQEYIIPGSFAQTHCFGRVLEYLEGGAVQVKELISHELPPGDYGKDLDCIVQKQACKVITHP